jgi:hypothetical protein
MKNPFIGCLKSYFSAKSLVKFYQLKIEKQKINFFFENLPIENTKARGETGRISAICQFHFW